ncbi:MAG: heme exporter protein CcmB, partial [Dehalococcoidia bacterium]
YAGKLLALAVSLAAVALVGGLLQLEFLDLDVALPGHLALALLLGVAALPPIVVRDVALTLRLRARAALVPILALPVLLPQLVAATNAASAAISGDAPTAVSWSLLLLSFALVYTVLGLTIVPTAIE